MNSSRALEVASTKTIEDTMATVPAPHILIVDDEEMVLSALRRTLRADAYEIHTATSGQEALVALAAHDFDVVVSDMRMPGMDGAQLLHAASVFSPDSERILLTGYSDQQATAEAINRGKISAYIGKPWDNQEIRDVLKSAVEKRHLRRQQRAHENAIKVQNRELRQINRVLEDEQRREQASDQSDYSTQIILEETNELKAALDGSISLMVSHIDSKLRDGLVKKRLTEKLVRALATNNGFSIAETEVLCEAARLHRLGMLNFSDDLLNKKISDFNEQEKALYKTYPIRSSETLEMFHQYRAPAAIICHLAENFDGSGFPHGIVGAAIPIGSRILKVAVELTDLTVDKQGSKTAVETEMQKKVHDELDYDIAFQALQVDLNLADECLPSDITINAAQLNKYTRVTRDVYDENGRMVFAKLIEVDELHRARLQKIEQGQGRPLEIHVDPESYCQTSNTDQDPERL